MSPNPKKALSGRGHSISSLFVFLLIGIFAIASITLVLSGINVYRQVTDMAARNTEKLITLSYFINKVHSNDASAQITVETYGDIQALVLRETYDDEHYETRIYEYGGTVYEQFVLADEEFDLEMGEILTDVRAVTFQKIEPTLLQVQVTLTDGSVQTMHMALRSHQAG